LRDPTGLLSGFRVLDMTDEKGDLCGKILGDFGADVIKIEPPGGSSARRIGPFYKNDPDPQKSLSWFAFNTSKRGITLNLETTDGRDIFRRLVKTAEFVVESYEPGYLVGLGLGFAELERIKPDIVVTSITPFGQTGPYSHYKATDLVAMAMGGPVSVMGEFGRPPVRMSCAPQAYVQAGMHAAVGSMVAHYHRALTGEGQHVDVSVQEAVVLSMGIAAEVYEMMKMNMLGTGSFFIVPRPEPLGLIFLRFLLPCKDGHVVVAWAGGHQGFIGSTRALVKWANEEGMGQEVKDFDFSSAVWDMTKIPQETVDKVLNSILPFLMTKTKAELFEGALSRGVMLAPCNTTADISHDRHLEARGFWQKMAHAELGEEVVYPGAPLKMSEAGWRIQSRAPLVGEHNQDIYEGELGFSAEQQAVFKARKAI